MGRDKGDEEDEGRGRLGLDRERGERRAADSQNSRFLMIVWQIFIFCMAGMFTFLCFFQTEYLSIV